MPKKLEECVNKLVSQGKTKEEAYAICNSTIDSNPIIIMDKGFSNYSKYIDETTGFLHVKGRLARDGIQVYYGLEFSKEIQDAYNLIPTEKYNVYRPHEEVFKKESLDTYINAPITMEHPSEFVNIDNAKELIKGSISKYWEEKENDVSYVCSDIVVTDKTLINTIKNGYKIEFSPGYTQDLIREEGEYKGKKYDFKQTNIKINHIASVERGRCEGSCKITTDNYNIIEDENKTKGNSMVKLKIGDAEVEVCDTVFAHIDDLKNKLVDTEAMVEKTTGENEKLKEDMEEEKKKTSDSVLDALVSEKVALIDTAKTLKVEVKATDSIMDMKKAIISSNSKISLDGKSTEFIDGVYETIIAGTVNKQKDIKDSQKKAFDGFDGNPQVASKFNDMAKETL